MTELIIVGNCDYVIEDLTNPQNKTPFCFRLFVRFDKSLSAMSTIKKTVLYWLNGFRYYPASKI